MTPDRFTELRKLRSVGVDPVVTATEAGELLDEVERRGSEITRLRSSVVEVGTSLSGLQFAVGEILKFRADFLERTPGRNPPDGP